MFGLIPRRSVERPWPYESPMELFRRDLAPLFERMFGRWPIFTETDLAPPYGAEMETTDEAVIVREAVPGFETKEIAVTISGNLLKVHAERKEKKSEKEELWGKLDRSVYLPEGLDSEHVEATYRNGILEVRLPKLPEAKERHIEVKTV
ncbi:MAG TPA: Hsp20/alpha crystallin family protein [Gemmataceae bacterium]